MRHSVSFLLVIVGIVSLGCHSFHVPRSSSATNLASSPQPVSIENADAKRSGAPIRFLSHETALEHSPNAQSGELRVTPDGSFESYGTREAMEIDPFGLSGVVPVKKSRDPLLQRLLNDQKNYYSGDSLLGLGGAFAIGGLFANTQLDHQIQKHFQSSVAGATSDEWFEFLHANKELGEGVYTLPIMGAAWLSGEIFDGSPNMERFGNWGERSMRGFIVGAPPLIAMQLVTGASRPGETANGSEWQPFQDNNGVSGHAFMSALPFITAAKMTDNPLKKSLWYLGSAIGPLSRVNDNAHYPSQIGLGWAMAYVAATAVDQTEKGDSQWRLIPFSASGGSGLALEYEW
ncbi:MAG: phosphatase PAP2 family protein [Pirellula sp.]|nr:phosphatase PAP2 family protein [Pirellula sp.]